MANSPVISDIVKGTDAINKPILSEAQNKANSTPKLQKSDPKKDIEQNSIAFVITISILVLVILIGISIIAYLKSK